MLTCTALQVAPAAAGGWPAAAAVRGAGSAACARLRNYGPAGQQLRPVRSQSVSALPARLAELADAYKCSIRDRSAVHAGQLQS
jgi:hypothetical protein